MVSSTLSQNTQDCYCACYRKALYSVQPYMYVYVICPCMIPRYECLYTPCQTSSLLLSETCYENNLLCIWQHKLSRTDY